MEWEHLQLDGSKPIWYVPHTKSGKSRYVILNPMSVQILEALPKIQGNPIQNPMKAFKRIIARAGIEPTFRLHDIRQTVASLIVNKGGSLYYAQAALNHANSSMSERYAHLSSESMTKTSDNISNVVSGAIEGKKIKSGGGRSVEVGL